MLWKWSTGTCYSTKETTTAAGNACKCAPVNSLLETNTMITQNKHNEWTAMHKQGMAEWLMIYRWHIIGADSLNCWRRRAIGMLLFFVLSCMETAPNPDTQPHHLPEPSGFSERVSTIFQLHHKYTCLYKGKQWRKQSAFSPKGLHKLLLAQIPSGYRWQIKNGSVWYASTGRSAWGGGERQQKSI